MKTRLLAIALLCVSAFAQVNTARMLSGVNYQNGTSYTYVSQDVTRVTVFSNVAATAVTLSSGLANPIFGAGSVLTTMNQGAGTVTITCSGCTINGSATLALTSNQSADIYGDGQNYVAFVTTIGGGGAGNPANPLGSIQGNNGGIFGGIPNTLVNFITGAISLSAPFSITTLTTGADVSVSSGGAIGSSPAGGLFKLSGFGGNLATAIAAIPSGGTLWLDQAHSVSATIDVSTPNITLRWTSPQAATTFTTNGRIRVNVPYVRFENCVLNGPDLNTSAVGAPVNAGALGDASGFAVQNCLVDGFGSTSHNGTIAISQASHVEISGVKTGTRGVGNSITVSTASWAQPLAGTMFGLETITANAALPSDFAVGNAVICTGMNPAGYNAPGDGQSLYFGKIISAASPSFTVQQLENPGTYVSGGTCTAGVGNVDWDVQVNSQTQQGDFNIHDNDLGEVIVHNQAVGGSLAGVKFVSNTVHPGMNNKLLENGFEVGDFSGQTQAMAQNVHGVESADNVCKIVADGTAGCYSYSIAQDVVETGNHGYSGGHTFAVEMDENVGLLNCTITGGMMNALGGGPVEDINRSSHCPVTGELILFPAPAASAGGINWSAASGGVGNTAPNDAAFDRVTGNIIKVREDICPPAGQFQPISCGALIKQIVGNGVTATVTFQPGVVDPTLFAGETGVIIQGNSQGGFNTTVTIGTVTGSGTGFTFSSATNATGTGGSAVGAGLTNASGTTAVAKFKICPHPFKVGDSFWTSLTGISNYGVTAGTVSAITQLAPCSVTYTIGTSGNGVSGGGIASNFNGKAIWMQGTAANAVLDGNDISLNTIEGPGANVAGSVGINIGSAGASANAIQILSNKISDVNSAYGFGGTAPPTNLKIELGSTTNFNNILGTFASGVTLADSSNNPQVVIGVGQGTCTANAVLYLYGFGQAAGTNCTQTTEGPGGLYVVKHAGTVIGNYITATVGPSAATAACTLRQNGTNKGTTTATLATGQTSASNVSGSFTVAPGDTLDEQLGTLVGETNLSGVKCKAYIWYQDN